jgi:hypothetical protein
MSKQAQQERLSTPGKVRHYFKLSEGTTMKSARRIKWIIAVVAIFATLAMAAPSFSWDGRGRGYYGRGYYGHGYRGWYGRGYYGGGYWGGYYRPYYRPYYYPGVSFVFPFPFFGVYAW